MDVFINGKHVGHHLGGYTRFCFDIASYIYPGQHNRFAIKVNNQHDTRIAPLNADFTFFGGIHRDLYLIETAQTHICTTDYASSGVYITTPTINEKSAEINIETLISNFEQGKIPIRVENTIFDHQGKKYKQKYPTDQTFQTWKYKNKGIYTYRQTGFMEPRESYPISSCHNNI